MTTADIVSAQPVSFLDQARRTARERQQRSAEERSRELAMIRDEAEKRSRDRWEAIQSALDQSVGRPASDEILGSQYEEPAATSTGETRWVTKIPDISVAYRDLDVWGPSMGRAPLKYDAIYLLLHGPDRTELQIPAHRDEVLAMVGQAVELEERRRAVAVSRVIGQLEDLSKKDDDFNSRAWATNALNRFCDQWGPDDQVDAAFTKCMTVLQDAQDKRDAALKAREERQARMWWNFKACRVTYGVKGKKGERWRTGHAWVKTPIAENDERGRGWYHSWDVQARKWIRVYYATVISIEEHSFDMAAARNECLFVKLEDGLILPPPGTEEQPA